MPNPPCAGTSAEEVRLAVLHRYRILDTPAEPAFDRIVTLAALLLDVPIALISLVDVDRQWFKAAYGLDTPETPRCIAFCDHAIRQQSLFIVPDARNDARFRDNPLVTAAPNLRFYAGAPLITNDGHALGTLCVLDRVPRQLDDRGRKVLAELAAQTLHELDVRAALGDHYGRIDRTNHAERALRSTNLQLAALLNVTSNAVVAADSAGRVTAWNRAAEEIFGYTPDEIGGQPISVLLSEPYRTAEAPFLSLAHAHLRAAPQRLHGRHRDGHEIPIEVSLASWGDSSATAAFGAIIRDFTARSIAEDELKHSRAHLADAQKIAGLGSWDWRLDEGLISLSEEMRVLLGTPDGAEISADDFLSRIHPDDADAFTREIARIQAREPPATINFRIRCDDDSVRLLRGSARLAAGWDGRSSRMIGVAQDITIQSRREAAERESEKLAALGELAGGVAHELNNLLQPVLSLTELALDRVREGTPTPDDLAEMADHFTLVLEYGRQAREIVRKILKFARHEPTVLTVLDLPGEVRSALSFLDDMLPAGVRMEINVPPDMTGSARVNAIELMQILTNLAVNAAHAMEGHGVLTISLRRETPSREELTPPGLAPGPYFRLCVGDTGWGMPDATKARIFEPFFTTKAVGEGTGLGLSVVHGILQSWNGAITVESEPGRGTRFSLFIPVHAPQ